MGSKRCETVWFLSAQASGPHRPPAPSTRGLEPPGLPCRCVLWSLPCGACHAKLLAFPDSEALAPWCPGLCACPSASCYWVCRSQLPSLGTQVWLLSAPVPGPGPPPTDHTDIHQVWRHLETTPKLPEVPELTTGRPDRQDLGGSMSV